MPNRIAAPRARFCPVFFATLLSVVSCVIVSTPAQAEALPPPEGPVLLKIVGELTLPNVGDELHLDKQTIESLPAVTISARPIASEALQTFTGALLSDILKLAGADPERFTATGLDNYKFSVAYEPLREYPVVVAYKQNGEYIGVRQLGPLRIMLPFEDYPELQTHKNEAIAVWQLVEIKLD